MKEERALPGDHSSKMRDSSKGGVWFSQLSLELVLPHFSQMNESLLDYKDFSLCSKWSWRFGSRSQLHLATHT